MKKLKERKKWFKLFLTISMTCCILGFLLCVGGIGHIELYDISKTPLTYTEENISYLISFIGLCVMGVGAIGANVCERNIHAIEYRMHKRHTLHQSNKSS